MVSRTLDEIVKLISPKIKSLVFAPHPDDEILGVGGIMAKFPGCFFPVCLTDGGGSKSQIAGTKIQRQKIVQERRANDVLSLEILGIYDCLYLNHPEIKSKESREAALKDILTILGCCHPQYIFLPSPYENEVKILTHRIATEIILEGVRKVRKSSNIDFELFGYEVWDSIPKGPGIIIEDISKQIRDVEAAMIVHKTERDIDFVGLKESRAKEVAVTFENDKDRFDYGERLLNMTSLLKSGMNLEEYCRLRNPKDYYPQLNIFERRLV